MYNIKITPRYKIKKKSPVDAGEPPKIVEYDRPNTTPSFHQYAMNVSYYYIILIYNHKKKKILIN